MVKQGSNVAKDLLQERQLKHERGSKSWYDPKGLCACIATSKGKLQRLPEYYKLEPSTTQLGSHTACSVMVLVTHS